MALTYKRRYNKTHYKNVTLKIETYRLLKEICRDNFMDCVHGIVLHYRDSVGAPTKTEEVKVTPIEVKPEISKEAEVRVEVKPRVGVKVSELVEVKTETPKVELVELPRTWIFPRAPSRTEAKIEKIKREIEELRERIEKIKQERLKKQMGAEAKPG